MDIRSSPIKKVVAYAWAAWEMQRGGCQSQHTSRMLNKALLSLDISITVFFLIYKLPTVCNGNFVCHVILALTHLRLHAEKKIVAFFFTTDKKKLRERAALLGSLSVDVCVCVCVCWLSCARSQVYRIVRHGQRAASSRADELNTKGSKRV